MLQPGTLNIPKQNPVITGRDNADPGCFKPGFQNLRKFLHRHAGIAQKLRHFVKQFYDNAVNLFIFLCLCQHSLRLKLRLLLFYLLLQVQPHKQLIQSRCHFAHRRVFFMKYLMHRQETGRKRFTRFV